MFYEKVFLESLANLQENACTRVSFLNMVASCRGFQKKKRIVVEFYLISANFQLEFVHSHRTLPNLNLRSTHYSVIAN